MNYYRNRTRAGFTIVELLIVIVVIAILAAISIVAYNGIQTRAENTKTINSVSSYAKAIKLYAVDNGTYPLTSPSYPCLGKVSMCANVTDTVGVCVGGRAQDSTVLNTALASMNPQLPEPSTQSMTCNGKQYSGAYYNHQNSAKDAHITFYLKGIIDCPTIAGTQVSNNLQNTETTVCRAVFPTLS